MTEGEANGSSLNDLRKRAEEMLRANPAAIRAIPAEDIQKLVHELQVHQIELEMQNEELRRSQLFIQEASSNYAYLFSRYSELFENAPVGYFTFDKNMKITGVNQTGASMLGLAKSKLLGKSLPCFGPDDGDILHFHLLKVFDTLKPCNSELRLKKSDGMSIYVMLESSPAHDESGVVTHCRTAVSDFSERKLAVDEKARMAMAVDHSTDAIVITDLAGIIQYVNPAFEKNTGYTRMETIGQNIRILNSGAHPYEFYKSLWSDLRNGQVWRGHIKNKRKDGTIYEDSATISPVFSEKGDIINYAGVYHDVTSEMQLQRAKEHFAIVIAHELNTPLTKLELLKSLMEKTDADSYESESFAKMTEIIRNCYDDFERIVSSSILFSDLSAEYEKVPFGDSYIYMIIQTCFENMKEFVAKRNRDVALSINLEQLPRETIIHVDQAMVTRLFDEIMSNAIKYTPDGKTVNLSAAVESGFVIIRIRDEGIGIPKVELNNVVEPFYSAEKHQNHSTDQFNFKGGGMGLGLTLAHLIVKYHNGYLDVNSDGDNRGVEAVIRLPVKT